MKKYFFIPSIVAATLSLSATQLAPKAVTDFIRGNQILSAKDNMLEIKKSSDLYSKKRLNIDTKKVYRLSGEFRQTGNTGTCIIRFGLIPSTKQRQIIPASINVVNNSATELASDCSAKDTVIKVKDASKWKTNALDRIVFDIDNDKEARDLPNFNIAKSGIKSIEKKTDYYEVTLTGPVGLNYGAGTEIRLHQLGWIAIFCCGANNKLTTNWKKLSFTFQPGTVAQANIFRWWTGTEFAQIYLTFNVPKGQSVEFKNICLEEVKK